MSSMYVCSLVLTRRPIYQQGNGIALSLVHRKLMLMSSL